MLKNQNSKKNIWVIGFPKSGNTWLSYLLSFSFNLRYIDYDDDLKTPKKKWIKNFTSGTLNHKSLKDYSYVKKTHKQKRGILNTNDYIFYIKRDPRDVYVSYNYFMKQKSSGFLGKIKYFIIGLFGKKNRIRWFFKKWQNHIEFWENDSIIIDYEDLLKYGHKYLYKKIKSLEKDIEINIIKEAIENFKFKKLSNGRSPGQEDNKNFFRKGISGDWKNKLSNQEKEEFKRLINRSNFQYDF
ncbi:MAG: hypothetical protein CMF80_03950 [Candidatus Marinimicrobia bacterium]|nr:hypothetical protein [Candidatus Neomarinimicrobiota bacterium]|tara:strand:+ start:1478 stop:2200 length:723 start_codon:yes stop_codon:yes gene_type:complete